VGGSSNDNCLSSGKGKELVAKARGQARREALCILIEFSPNIFPLLLAPPYIHMLNYFVCRQASQKKLNHSTFALTLATPALMHLSEFP